jgi:hypothetical protein
VLHREAPPQHGPLADVGRQAREDVGVEHVAVEGHRERERRHCEEGTADAQGGEAEQHRHHAARRARREQRGEQVDVPVLHHVAGDDRSAAHDGELAQADVAAPPGEDDE